jgi:hypothetical protein
MIFALVGKWLMVYRALHWSAVNEGKRIFSSRSPHGFDLITVLASPDS